jgi:hypothetical protein
MGAELSVGEALQKGAEFVQKCMLETLKRHLGQVSREIVERALSTCPPILQEGVEKGDQK